MIKTNNTKRVAITGANGMLATDVQSILANKGFSVTSLTRQDLDITDALAVTEYFNNLNPDIIINCAAYTKVDDAEDHRDDCWSINVDGVKNLVDASAAINAVFVQFSTDYVFDGQKEGYNEDEIKKPLNYYGLSKAKAEDLIQQTLSKYYIIRTSWLVGHSGKNFVDTVIRICTEKGMMKVVNDQIGSPTFTVDLAAAVPSILEMDYGVYHITNTGFCSWFDFSKEIIRQANIEAEITPCTSAEYIQKAKRPSYSILNNNKVAGMQSWQDALTTYLN